MHAGRMKRLLEFPDTDNIYNAAIMWTLSHERLYVFQLKWNSGRVRKLAAQVFHLICKSYSNVSLDFPNQKPRCWYTEVPIPWQKPIGYSPANRKFWWHFWEVNISKPQEHTFGIYWWWRADTHNLHAVAITIPFIRFLISQVIQICCFSNVVGFIVGAYINISITTLSSLYGSSNRLYSHVSFKVWFIHSRTTYVRTHVNATLLFGVSEYDTFSWPQ